MGKTRIMTRNEDHDASSKKGIKISDNSASWPDLNRDVLFLVMMQLRVVDFLAFSGVCKSWRLFALSNRNKFMVSKQPMSMYISSDANEKDKLCYLEDFEGRRFKTILLHSGGRICVGLTCGYLVLFGKKTRDFWLVNPITRRELHFPGFFFDICIGPKLRVLLVFSRSICGWVFIMTDVVSGIWFSIAGRGSWNQVSCPFLIVDLLVFNGKIYTINNGGYFCELKLNSVPALIFLRTKNCPIFLSHQVLVSLGENLYVMEYSSNGYYKLHKLDFYEMNSVSCTRTREECGFFHSKLLKQFVPVKPELWAASMIHYKRFADTQGRLFTAKMWFFPHDCLNVNLVE